MMMVEVMIMMIILMKLMTKMTKKHTNIMTFEYKFTNFKASNIVK